MRIVKLLVTGLVASSLIGCTCKPHQRPEAVTNAGDTGRENIPAEGEDGPLKRIFFAFDSSAIDAAAQSTLRADAEYLKTHPEVKTTIEGHCDERGTNEYNMALGQRRATATKKYLQSLGIAASRLETMSYGENSPADPGHTEESWAKNRRAQFRIQ